MTPRGPVGLAGDLTAQVRRWANASLKKASRPVSARAVVFAVACLMLTSCGGRAEEKIQPVTLPLGGAEQAKYVGSWYGPDGTRGLRIRETGPGSYEIDIAGPAVWFGRPASAAATPEGLTVVAEFATGVREVEFTYGTSNGRLDGDADAYLFLNHHYLVIRNPRVLWLGVRRIFPHRP